MSFTADDAALAAEKLGDEATADIQYVNQRQYDLEITPLMADARGLIANVMKLHGLNHMGDPTLGDDDRADAIITEAKAYRADADAYARNLFGANVPAHDLAAAAAELDQPDSMPPAQMHPAMSLQQAINPPAVHLPVAKLDFIPRGAQALFPGISSTYHNEMIPTAAWRTPQPVLPDLDEHFQFNGYQILIMAMAIEEKKNVIATGDPGCGKTEFFKQFGARIGLPVNKIPFDGNLTRAEIIGSFRQVATPTGSETPFVLGLIPRLIQQPGIIVLDEIDQADPDIMYMLHPVLEGDGLTIQEEGGTLIPRHPNCYIVATANTKGRGSDNGLTHARYEMSEATRDRFPYWLSFTFMQPAQEAKTINAKTALPPALCEKMVTVANEIRTAYSAGALSQTCSLRQLLDVVPAYRRFSAHGDLKALALGMDTVMAGRANKDDGLAIQEWINQTLSIQLHDLER